MEQMTNEDLAIQIQLGHSEYYPVLWDKTKHLLKKILYQEIRDYLLPNYIAAEDLEQELYFAYCLAVQAFDTYKPYMFNSYLYYSVKRILIKSLYKDPANVVSFNQKVTINNGDSDGDELIDLMEDKRAGAFTEKCEILELQRTVRQAISELPYNERRVIYLRYLKNKDYDEMSKLLGADKKLLMRWKSNGLELLAKNRNVRYEYHSMWEHYSGKESSRVFGNPCLRVS